MLSAFFLDASQKFSISKAKRKIERKWFFITEVARTRLREENSVYRSFWQTLFTVYKNEGRRGLYRGLVTQLIRQIPNTAIMMSTYELTVYVLTKWLKEPQKISHNSSWLRQNLPGENDD